MSRILVCGGRDYADVGRVFAVLDELDHDRRARQIIQGGGRGADMFARFWAEWRRRECVTVHAGWDQHGRAAGPIRNQTMIDRGADLVVAFPGGKGTEDMVRRARKAGVEVIEIATPRTT